MRIVGISGRSCSGKSTIVEHIKKKYNAVHINQDKFFKVRAENWESPDAIRFDKLIEAIKNLRDGKRAFVPAHRWTEVFDREVNPDKMILVDGYLLFVDKELSDLFDDRIWIDVSDVNILYRRTKRDGTSRYIDYTMGEVIPTSKRYENIQSSRADIIIDGNTTLEHIIEQVEEYLDRRT